MTNLVKKIHLAGVVAFLTTVAGLCGDPAILGYLPPPWSVRVALVGAIAAAFTRQVNAGDKQLVPKEPTDG